MERQITIGALIILGLIMGVFTVVSMWIDEQLDWSLSSIIGVSLAIGALCIVIALFTTSV